MTDEELSNGEIRRTFETIREEFRRNDTALRDEIRSSSEAIRDEIRRNHDGFNRRMDDMVTTDSWQRENTHLAARIEEVGQDCRERTGVVQGQINDIKGSKKLTWDRVPLYLAVLATLLGAVYTAYAAARGK